MVNRYIITSAQACYCENKDGDQMPYGVKKGIKWAPKAVPHYQFLKGLETCAKETGAKLIIQPVAGKNTLEDILHDNLANRDDIYRDKCMVLNKNLQIRDVVVPPQNVDPTTGKATLVSKYNSSLIFPHTKQRFTPVSVFNAELPRYLYTPGAVTLPNYNVATHRGDTAERNHVFGALFVEVLDETYYNITNLRAMKNGKFVDRGKLYDGNKKPEKIETDFMVLGDLHIGNHDKQAMEATYEMIAKFKPKSIFLHDVFDGYSINHHDENNYLMRVREFKKGRLSLDDELKQNYEELMKLSNAVGKGHDIYIVASNHHAFLKKYINECGWANKDLWNADIGAYLYHKGISINKEEHEIDDAAYLIYEGIKKFGSIPDKIKFLRLKDNLRRFGIQLASHGDKGSGGARGGGAKSREITGGGKSITGHSHRMEIYGDTYIVGTNGLLDAVYTAGYGNANIAANAVGYSNGLVQILPIIEGRWMNFGLYNRKENK
jgi:hypothetical protein